MPGLYRFKDKALEANMHGECSSAAKTPTRYNTRRDKTG
jgi:hypothetical protein